MPDQRLPFASDNTAPAHPAAIDAIERANHGHAPAYGDDEWTARAATAIAERFGAPAEVLFVFNGTGANVVALSTMLSGSDAVICASTAHVEVDEGGAPERFLGAKLLASPTTDGKLRPEHIEHRLWLLGDVHHVQPRVVSIAQPTELGTLYSPDEIAALCDLAHAHNMRVHVDGARLGNAVAALGGDLWGSIVDAGVDAVVFGGTKAGLVFGEAVVLLDPALAARAPFLRKQAMQLPSKSRFIAAQFEALLADDLWLDLAGHANAMARRLHEGLGPVALGDLGLSGPPAVNSLFPVLPFEVAARLGEVARFYPWDLTGGTWRWMTSWCSTTDEVDRFAVAITSVLAGPSEQT